MQAQKSLVDKIDKYNFLSIDHNKDRTDKLTAVGRDSDSRPTSVFTANARQNGEKRSGLSTHNDRKRTKTTYKFNVGNSNTHFTSAR